MLDAAKTLQAPVHHDRQASAEGLTFFHAEENEKEGISREVAEWVTLSSHHTFQLQQLSTGSYIH